jgi:prophage regulatory protein
MTVVAEDILLRRPQVQALTGLSRSTLYNFISRGMFPAPVRLGLRSVAWRKSQVSAWIESRQPAREVA